MASTVPNKEDESSSQSENEQTSKNSNDVDDGSLYPILDVEDSQKKGWLSQAQQRQQALTGLQSLCNQYCVSVKQQKSAFSADSDTVSQCNAVVSFISSVIILLPTTRDQPKILETFSYDFDPD